MTTLLFFDDQRLDFMRNVRLGVGQPELIKESVYQDPDINPHFGYPTVFFDEPSGKWRMLYQGRNQTKEGVREPDPKLIAESDDGLAWYPLDTSRDIELEDRHHVHQLLPRESHGQWNAYLDVKAPPTERFKGLVGKRGEGFQRGMESNATLLVSPDGINWSERESVWHPSPPDPLTSVFWNEVRQSYVITTRPEGGDRRIAFIETKDWKTYSEPELVMQTDSLDAHLTQIYGMPVIPYEGYYVGFVWLFHCVPEPSTKYLGGHMDCQLAYSLNGWHFQRGIRTSFIPNGGPGEPDSGTVYPTCVIPKDNGDLWIYASACTLEHGNVLKGDTGTLIAYRLRKDGFTYVESTGGNGVIGTRTIYWNEGELSLNVQAQGGDVRVQVTDSPSRSGIFTTPPNVISGYSFDDCIPFSGDNIDWRPTWKDGKTLDALSGKAIRIEVQLNSSRLYAIRGDFVNMLGRQKNAFDSDGTIPQERSGF